mmetsp:Transcript_26525/g.79532  ORF Transcript_26525/g.79532 Transcript_26525/m.79532 type:complete len:112 (-) Transcript_26525:73-408(-)
MKRALVVLALAGTTAAAPRHSSHRDRAFRNAKRECEQTACAALPPGTNANCVHACVSQSCYDEIYAAEPLEDGEVDARRARAFQSCQRKEHSAARTTQRREKQRATRAAEP